VKLIKPKGIENLHYLRCQLTVKKLNFKFKLTEYYTFLHKLYRSSIGTALSLKNRAIGFELAT
jgi:hypothetical protein